MISSLVSDEKILAYMEKTHEISHDGNLIRDEFLVGEKWEKIEQQSLLRLQEYPGDAFTMDALGHHYRSRKQYPVAIAMYKQALKASSTPASIQHHIAFTYYCQGDVEKALEEFREIDIDQLNSEGMYSIDWRELDYLDEEYYVEIIPPPLTEKEQFEEALQFKMKTLLHNAYMYTQMGVFEIAIECFQELLSLTPKASCILNKLGVIYIHANQLKMAKKTFTEAIQCNPGLEAAYLNLGFTHSKLGEHELAIGILKKASIKFPDNSEAWLELSKAYMKLNYKQKAIDCLVKALQTGAEEFFNQETIAELLPILETAYEQFNENN